MIQENKIAQVIEIELITLIKIFVVVFHAAQCDLELSAMPNLADVLDADKRLSCSWIPLSYPNKDIFFSKLEVRQAEI